MKRFVIAVMLLGTIPAMAAQRKAAPPPTPTPAPISITCHATERHYSDGTSARIRTSIPEVFTIENGKLSGQDESRVNEISATGTKEMTISGKHIKNTVYIDRVSGEFMNVMRYDDGREVTSMGMCKKSEGF